MRGEDGLGEIWHWAQLSPEGVTRASLEVAGKAREIASSVGTEAAAVVICRHGSRIREALDLLASRGVRKAYVLRSRRSAGAAGMDYDALSFTSALCGAVSSRRPWALLFPASADGADLAPRVAARLGTGLTAHCIDLQVERREAGPLLLQLVPGFGDNVVVSIACPEKRPQMATIRPGVFPVPEPEGGTDRPNVCEEVFEEEESPVEAFEFIEEEEAGADLERADVIVAGGAGAAALKGFGPIEALAAALGAAVAGTRPAVDKGWVSSERMIGQSGKTVRPRLFISLGASGAMHFTTGFLDSGAIFAVTSDPGAPILRICDVGIVGDLKEVMPVLLEKMPELLTRR